MDEENVTQETVTQSQNTNVDRSGGQRKEHRGTGLLVVSLILGILAILFAVCDLAFLELLSIVSIVLGVIGLILCHAARKEGNVHAFHMVCFIINVVAVGGGVFCLGFWLGWAGVITIAARVFA